MEAVFRLKDEKLIQNVGVSIYNMEEGYEAIRQGMDYVQLPYSILDQRGNISGFMQEAKKAGMTVFTRSAFLQGLFMMRLDEIPSHLKHSKPYLQYFEKLVAQCGVSKAELLIEFVKASEGIDYLVFGVDSKAQLLEDMAAFQSGRRIEGGLLEEIREYYKQVDDSIILPSLWANGRKAE